MAAFEADCRGAQSTGMDAPNTMLAHYQGQALAPRRRSDGLAGGAPRRSCRHLPARGWRKEPCQYQRSESDDSLDSCCGKP